MRIFYSITKSEIGGAQVHVAQLAKHMKDAGHAVAVMSAPGGWLENEATRLGVRFYPNKYFANSFNPINLFRAKSVIKKAMVEWRPDIVHAHSSFAGILTRLVVRGKIPTIFTAHSWAFTDGASPFRRLIAPISERMATRFTKKIICVSEYDKALALRYKIVPEEKLAVVYNGVQSIETDDFQKEDTIVSVGRLAYPKEYILLLEAFAVSGISTSLKIIGSGPDEEKIKEKISALGIGGKVILAGNLQPQEVREELQKSRAFILISKHEGLPMTILEAMSAGLPIVASNVGGIPEELVGGAGILVENKKEEIAKALKTLEDEERRATFGRAAQKRFQENFTLEKFLSKTEKIYNEIILK